MWGRFNRACNEYTSRYHSSANRCAKRPLEGTGSPEHWIAFLQASSALSVSTAASSAKKAARTENNSGKKTSWLPGPKPTIWWDVFGFIFFETKTVKSDFLEQRSNLSELRSAPKPSLVQRLDPRSSDILERKKIAAFDFDSTLTSNVGQFVPSQVSQYSLWSDEVVPTLQRLHRDGYSLLILTNQKGIGKSVEGKKAATVKGAIDMVVEKAGVPMDALLSTSADCYRKPDVGMWQHYLALIAKKRQRRATSNSHRSGTSCGSSIEHTVDVPGGDGPRSLIDLSQCFFVGDAAGRPGDHSDSDRQFAANAGLRFLLPEEIFRSDSAVVPGAADGGTVVVRTEGLLLHGSADDHGGVGVPGPCAPPLPLSAIAAAVGSPAAAAAAAAVQRPQPIVLVLVGLSGSGKSTFAASLLARSRSSQTTTSSSSSSSASAAEFGRPNDASFEAASARRRWVAVCQDELGSRAKCEQAVGAALARGHSVVVDRTNLTPEQRSSWVALAAQGGGGSVGATCHALTFALPLSVCRDRVRARTNHATGVAGENGVRVLSMMLRKGTKPPSAEAEKFSVVSEVRDEDAMQSALDAYAGGS